MSSTLTASAGRAPVLEWGVTLILASLSLYKLWWYAWQPEGLVGSDFILFFVVAVPYALNVTVRMGLYVDAWWLNRRAKQKSRALQEHYELVEALRRVQRLQFYTRAISAAATLSLLIQGLAPDTDKGVFPSAMQGLSTGLAAAGLVLGLYSLGIDGMGAVFDDANWPL